MATFTGQQSTADAPAGEQQFAFAPPLLPQIEVSHFGQDISFVATSGPVQAIAITARGSGYTTAPTVTIDGKGAGSGATATAVLGTGADAGKVVGVTVTAAGSGYTGTASVTFTGGGGSGAEGSVVVNLSNRAMFQDWANDYIQFITNSGVSVAYINVGDYKTDNKHAYDYLRPELGDDGVPWIVTDFLDKLPQDVHAGTIAYLDVANPWHLYDPPPPDPNAPAPATPPNRNFPGNTFTTDGRPTSPAMNNMYQSFLLVNQINAAVLKHTPADGKPRKFITHYEADGEGAGAFETDTYYGFGGAPANATDPYNPATPNQTAPGTGWTWDVTHQSGTGWPVAGYGYTKWLWNHFMPGATDVPQDGIAVPLPAGGDVPDVVFTDAEAVIDATWSAATSPMPYQFGIIKYAQTSWLQYSPGPMRAYTENYWFGEMHYGPGPGSAIAPDATAMINFVATPILNAPKSTGQFTNQFTTPPTVTFNQPVDASGQPIGTAAMGYAIMGTGAIDQTAYTAGEQAFFGGNGVGSGFGTGAWVAPGEGGSGYLQGDIVWFTAPEGTGRAAWGTINTTTGDRYNPAPIAGVLIQDPGEGYQREPTVARVTKADGQTPSGGSGAVIQALVLAADGYPQVVFPAAPANGRTAKGYVTVSPQNYRPGAITGLKITDFGAGYPLSPNTPTTPDNPLAGPGGLEIQFTGVAPAAPYNVGISGTPSAPPLYAPVNASNEQVTMIVITVLGDHYDTATNAPYYTLSGDPSQTKQHLTGGGTGKPVNPNYNAAYVPALDRSGGFPVDPTGRSSITIIDGGFGYGAGAVLETQGSGYDNKTQYPVTFPAPQAAGGTAAKGLLVVNSDGAVTNVVVTSAGSGYTAADDGTAFTLPAPGSVGGTAATAKAYLANLPKVSISVDRPPPAGTFTVPQPYVITGPTDPKNPGQSDPSTGYIVTGIGFTYPGVGYPSDTTFSFAFTPPANVTGSKTAIAQALPALATKYSAASLPALGPIADLATATSIQGGANAYNWQISNGFGPGQVSSVTIVGGGSGYTTAPQVTFSAPPAGGKPPTATAVVSGGVVTQIVIDQNGNGYGYDPANPPTVTIAPPGGTGTPATATVVLGDVQIMSVQALETVYARYASRPALLANMFNDQNYQDVALPKLGEEFYWPLTWTDFTKPFSTDGTKVAQNAIATFSIESLNRSNTFNAAGEYVPGTDPAWKPTKTALDSKYQPDASLSVPNTLGGTFSGLSSLTYAQFVGFLNSAAEIIASTAAANGHAMTPQDVTFQVYDAAFLPLEWLTQANPNRWSDENAAPAFVSPAAGTVVENTPESTPIYSAQASDIGSTWAERTVTYSLEPGVGDADALSIDPRSGEVRLRAAANYEVKRVYRFVVVARDGGSPALTAEMPVTIAVQDVAEPPTAPAISAPARFEIREHAVASLVFPVPAFSDADSPPSRKMTVSLEASGGTILARGGPGVSVTGSGSGRIVLRGTVAALNRYLAEGRVSYRPRADESASLSLLISESYGGFTRTATAGMSLDVVPVDDAPSVQAPARFLATEDTPVELVWRGIARPFADPDSQRLSVTLEVAAGTLVSAGGPGVTVGGSERARTFSGSPADLNRLFRRRGGITYTPAADATGRVALTTTVDDGTSRASATSGILIEAVNDAPTQRETGLVLGAEAGRPFRIGLSQLVEATDARDVDSPRPSFLITGTTSGRIERQVGGRWVPIAADAPARTRIIDGRRPFRWIAPADAVGTTAAFTVRAWDGRSASLTTSQISVSIAATDDTAFAYFIDDHNQVPNVPAGYGVISEFSETQRASAVASGRIVGESAAMFNQEKGNPVGYSLWPLISDLFQSRTPVAAADKPALAAQILGRVLVNPGLSATSEFPSPDEGTPASPGAGYVIWAQDFEFTPGVVLTTDVYAGVTAVLWAGRTYLGESFKIMPVPSSSLFKTLGDTPLPQGKGLYVADEIINGTATTPYLASLGLEGLPENPQAGSNGQWNFLSLLYANGLIDGFFGQNYNTSQVGIVTADTLPFHDASLPYAIQSAHDNPTQVATGGPWSTVYNGDVPFHATVYWAGDVDPTWGQPPKKPSLRPTQAPLPTTAFAAYGR